MGAPLAGSDLRAYVITGGGISFSARTLQPKVRLHTCLHTCVLHCPSGMRAPVRWRAGLAFGPLLSPGMKRACFPCYLQLRPRRIQMIFPLQVRWFGGASVLTWKAGKVFEVPAGKEAMTRASVMS